MDFHSKGSVVRYANSSNFVIMPEAIRAMIDVLRGLEYLHELNLYHNDIKPQNILLGKEGHALLTDYGISCQAAAGSYVLNRGFYKLHAAPEVLMTGQMNHQTDIYQCGLTLFRLLNGLGCVADKWNMLGESEFNKLVKRGEVVLPKDYSFFLPSALGGIVAKAIHVDPVRRYASVLAMRRALEKLSYKGYWTTIANGDFEGNDSKYKYRFLKTRTGKGIFAFTAYKMSKQSKRETRIAAFSAPNLTLVEVNKLQKKFFGFVVKG